MTVTERNIERNVTPSPFRERGLLTCMAKKEEERNPILYDDRITDFS
jgi:hypothetical protein